MKRSRGLTLVCAGSLLGMGLVLAAFATADEAPVPTLAYHNVHLAVPDPDAARAWYVEHAGAVERDGGVYVGDVTLSFVRSEAVLRSEGSVIDHIGISYPDLDATIQEMEAAGATVLSPVRDAPGIFRFAYVEDPWGVKIELVEDPEWPDFHHVHLRVPDPAATIDWFESHVGGTRESLKGRIEGLRYGGVWLLATGSSGEMPVPSLNGSIQNVAWTVADLDAATAEFRREGVTVVSEPRPYGNLLYAFFTDPNQVRIELLQLGE